MDNNEAYSEELQKHIKQQEDLIKLMQVIDDCMQSLDKFYYLAKTKQMLDLSNNN